MGKFVVMVLCILYPHEFAVGLFGGEKLQFVDSLKNLILPQNLLQVRHFKNFLTPLYGSSRCPGDRSLL